MSKGKKPKKPISKKTQSLLKDLQRKRGVRELAKRFLIVCEDDKSAPNYFQALKKHWNRSRDRLHFQQSDAVGRGRRGFAMRPDRVSATKNLHGFYVPRDSTVGPPKASGPTYKTSEMSANPASPKPLSKQVDSLNSLQDPRCSVNARP